jgi:formamidopyrimidine-DNA glycosylase
MPELPEVETVANGVDARVRGQRILSVWTSGKPQTFKTAESDIIQALTGGRIARVYRAGKTIAADIAPPSGDTFQFLIHLGMTGRELRFVDPRRFGRLSIAKDLYLGAGAEPTTISATDFAKLFKGRKLAIKAALLNQSIVHGVGNIYADESLFHAGIRPRKQAGRLTRVELTRLHAALQTVLAHAIKLGGSSVSDYVDADGIRGFFQLEHKVYSRAGQLCHDCASPLKKIIVGGRTTIYCPKCQR